MKEKQTRFVESADSDFNCSWSQMQPRKVQQSQQKVTGRLKVSHFIKQRINTLCLLTVK